MDKRSGGLESDYSTSSGLENQPWTLAGLSVMTATVCSDLEAGSWQKHVQDANQNFTKEIDYIQFWIMGWRVSAFV